MVGKIDLRQRIVVLGTGPALASASRDNTFFLFESAAGSLFIDCAGSPFHKLLKVGADPDSLAGVILTHSHPDHIYGLPSLIHELWLHGRRDTLHIFANAATQRVAEALLDVFQLRAKPVPLEFHIIPGDEGHLLLESESYWVHTSPVRHEVPTSAVRITSRENGRVAAFSADTSPCSELVALARGADLLFHECSVETPHPFHSTPEQVGELAAEADVGQVILVHCHRDLTKEPYLPVSEIRKRYQGEVRFAKDLEEYEL
ncbi:MAG TPA: ribonuclease Z [Anaerolineae bacterium]|nr:ribonuclease Z [Anaerolineae bacterium]